ncbi:4-O-methyl-glucuronoyl methylesterase 1-like [Gallus gallus]|uniref:4-O-methyl-glucuronoyl methylesterase 1-like n=1 Tax=Gallus gallus TaxID=9031 RepID=UPI001EFFEF58|nr:4-O-methyl-glucuronoyl methylesterase 1-like [Gallus gallus]
MAPHPVRASVSSSCPPAPSSASISQSRTARPLGRPQLPGRRNSPAPTGTPPPPGPGPAPQPPVVPRPPLAAPASPPRSPPRGGGSGPGVAPQAQPTTWIPKLTGIRDRLTLVEEWELLERFPVCDADPSVTVRYGG